MLPAQPLHDPKKGKIERVKGAEGAQHSFSDEEKEAFVEHINSVLKTDKDLPIPINSKTMQLFEVVKDGLLLCKLINKAVAGTIDERALNKPAKNIYTMTENQNLAILSAKAIGCSVVNIGAQDLIDGTVHLCLGLIWQIIQVALLAPVSLKDHPELVRLLAEGETLDQLVKLRPEDILKRWVNHHLKNAKSNRRVQNFTNDVKDGEVYTLLLNQIAGKEGCDLGPLKLKDPLERAEAVLKNADKINCRKFVSPFTIVSGHPRLNLGFVATLFNERPGLALPTVEEKQAMPELAKLVVKDENAADPREERAFKIWLNGLDLDDLVHDLFEDLRNGLLLLRVEEKIMGPVVDWKKVSLDPKTRYHMTGNCDMALQIAKDHKFSLVGIGGSNIVDGHKQFTLALIWQLMRYHTLSILRSLTPDGSVVEEKTIIAWANETVKQGGKSKLQMTSFKDSALKSCILYADLLEAVRPGSINEDAIRTGNTDEDNSLNAKFVISIARRLGITVFCVWEDLVQVKPKMTLTFVAGVMAYALGKDTTRSQAPSGKPPALVAKTPPAVTTTPSSSSKPSFLSSMFSKSTPTSPTTPTTGTAFSISPRNGLSSSSASTTPRSEYSKATAPKEDVAISKAEEESLPAAPPPPKPVAATASILISGKGSPPPGWKPK